VAGRALIRAAASTQMFGALRPQLAISPVPFVLGWNEAAAYGDATAQKPNALKVTFCD